MIRRTPFAFALLALVVGAFALARADDAVRSIDPAKSQAQFSVTHVFVEHVTGKVPIVKGSVTLRDGSPVPIDVSAVLDPSKVATGDGDRDDALAGPDFFDAKKYPTWTFTSTKIVARAKDAFELDGNLTIHGTTQAERLSVTIAGDAAHPAYRATCSVDRHAFGMAVSRLDPAIGGTVSIELDIVVK